MPLAEIIPLVLTAVLASIPVALPATFTLASALGARALAKLGRPADPPLRGGRSGDDGCPVRRQDRHADAQRADGDDRPPDARLRRGARSGAGGAGQFGWRAGSGRCRHSRRRRRQAAVADAPKLVKFVPFDPATKMSEATVADAGRRRRSVIVKGAFAVVIGLAQPSPTATAAANELEGQGFRVLAVAAGPPAAMKLVGLIALSDPPRADSAALVTELHGLGVRTVMVTGDAPATAAIVAHAVGLDGAVCPPGPIPDGVRPETFAVFAGVLPEDKYKLVKAFQKGGHTVGMCGDGANDAPALRQAQIGIAVSTATDVAKSAAGMVLTEPGPRRHRRRGQGRAGDVPAHPDLHAELHHQEDRAGALPGRRPDHDRACDPDPAADGH